MPEKQYAHGLWGQFLPSESPFDVPNGMEDNIRVIDDHLGLYTMQPPQPAGTPLPSSPQNGQGQIYQDGTYATFNAGSWRTYPARIGVKAALIFGARSWVNVGTGWEQFASIDESTEEGIQYVQQVKTAAVAAINQKVNDVAAAAHTIVTQVLDAFELEIDQELDDLQAEATARVEGMGFRPPTLYAAGIALNSPAQTVEYAGTVYSPVASALPFTTSGAFEVAKFRVVQGLTSAAIGGAGGAAIVGLAQGGHVQDGITFATPEMFQTLYGTIGSGANDNAQLAAALNTGKPVFLNGPTYKFNNVTRTVAGQIWLGDNTVIRNVQTGGTKRRCIQFNGGGLLGTAANVTGITSAGVTPTAFHTDTVVVDDASQFTIGDTVQLFEDQPLLLCTRSANPGEYQDFNYREFSTIQAINGNAITFNEFLRFPYSTERSLKLQRASFLEGAFVYGGRFVGGNAGGGGVGFSFCRYSGTKGISGFGNSEADRNGGPPQHFENCWECTSDSTVSKWTLFTHQGVKNQSCQFMNIRGKRTTNGGVMSSGDRFCNIGPIVQDSPGDNNGDGLGVSNGARFNTYGPFLVSGARCYSMWLHQSCDDNTFPSFVSVHGITGAVYCFGDRNGFPSLVVRDHPSFGAQFNGNDNYANVDIQVQGTGVSIPNGTRGNQIFGRSVSTGTDTFARDFIIGDCTDTRIVANGGVRGLVYANGVLENHTNEINLTGPNPYFLGKAKRPRGAYTWNGVLTGVTNTVLRDIYVPGASTDTNGLKKLVPFAGDNGEVYTIKLRTMTGGAGTYSEYRALTRQNTWYLEAVTEGISSFAPRLNTSPVTDPPTPAATSLQVRLNTYTSPLQVNVLVERF